MAVALQKAKMATRINYVVQGSVRGHVSNHRTLEAAIKSMHKDWDSCSKLGGGSYSDAKIYEVLHGASGATGRQQLQAVDIDEE